MIEQNSQLALMRCIQCDAVCCLFYRFSFAIVTAKRFPFISMKGNKINRTLNALIVCVRASVCVSAFAISYIYKYSALLCRRLKLNTKPECRQRHAGMWSFGFCQCTMRYCIWSWVAYILFASCCAFCDSLFAISIAIIIHFASCAIHIQGTYSIHLSQNDLQTQKM